MFTQHWSIHSSPLAPLCYRCLDPRLTNQSCSTPHGGLLPAVHPLYRGDRQDARHPPPPGATHIRRFLGLLPINGALSHPMGEYHFTAHANGMKSVLNFIQIRPAVLELNHADRQTDSTYQPYMQTFHALRAWTYKKQMKGILTMEHSHSCKANSHTGSTEIPCHLWNSKVHNRVHKRRPSVPISNKINSTHSPKSYYRKIHFNIILYVRLWIWNGTFPSRPPTKILYKFLIYPKRTTCPAHVSLWLVILITFYDG
jgi:hypothetical protein